MMNTALIVFISQNTRIREAAVGHLQLLGCKYCTVWTRNKKEMTEHVKRAHDDVLKSRRIEHEQREKIEEKERLLIELQQRWRGDNLQRNIAVHR